MPDNFSSLPPPEPVLKVSKKPESGGSQARLPFTAGSDVHTDSAGQPVVEDRSSLTHVTRLEDLNSSVLTLDQTFFQQRFHESDISTISSDTVEESNSVLNRGMAVSESCQSTNPEDKNVSQNRKSDCCISNPQTNYQNDASANKENTQVLESCVDDLWTEVRACSRARQMFRDKTNLLNTAFCGRGSVGSVYSDASTVDYLYTDTENGVQLIERHLPSLCGSTGSRRSVDSVLSVRSSDGQISDQNCSQDTVIYNWQDAHTDWSDTNSVVRSKLKHLGDDPGPVTMTTRQTYLRRLSQLENNPDKKLLTKTIPGT